MSDRVWSSYEVADLGQVNDVAVADLDNDGYLDIAAGCERGGANWRVSIQPSLEALLLPGLQITSPHQHRYRHIGRHHRKEA